MTFVEVSKRLVVGLEDEDEGVLRDEDRTKLERKFRQYSVADGKYELRCPVHGKVFMISLHERKGEGEGG
jgi:hypothetical protein